MVKKPNLTSLQNLDTYLSTILVETDADPQPWGAIADDWQKKDVQSIAPALNRLVHPRSPTPTVRRAWWTRARAHAKTADVAMLLAWVLAFSRRRRRGVWIAADRDQSAEGLDSINTLCGHNEWLAKLLTIRRDKVENTHTGSVIYFTTSDVASAYGWKDCDIFTLDEVTHWRANGEDLWSAMFSAWGKRRNALLFALMNAGHDGTWQKRLRDAAAADPTWAFSELPDAVASWIDIERLRDQQKYLPQAAFDRLWRNKWCSSLGDAIPPEFVHRAFVPGLAPMKGDEDGYSFILGCDLSLKRDFSAAVTLAVPANRLGKVRLADIRIWKPQGTGGTINLLDVAGYILSQDEKYGLEAVCIDAWQAEALAQSLELTTRHTRRSERKFFWNRPWVQTIQPTSATLREQASLLIEYLTDDRFAFFPNERLRNDLVSLRAEERPTGGFKLVSPRSATSGHGDAASALMVCLPAAHELATEDEAGVVTCGFEDDRPKRDYVAEVLNQRPQESVRRRIDDKNAPLLLWAWRASKGLRADHPYL